MATAKSWAPPADFDLGCRIHALQQQAMNLQRQGALDQAERLYHQVLELSPGHPDALHLLGLIAFQRGQGEAAVQAIGAALANSPGPALYHSNLGAVLTTLGRSREAEEHLRTAVALSADSADAYSNLANAQNLQGSHAEAVKNAERALLLAPGHSEACNNLGVAHQGLYRFDAAIVQYGKALEKSPNNLAFLNNRGQAFYQAGQLEPARLDFERILALDPNHVTAHWHRALVLFGLGRLEEAWREFRWRHQLPANLPFVRSFPQARWQGEDLSGQSLLVVGEQGVGDELEYSSVIADLTTRARRVVVECDERLVGLFARSFAGVEVVARRTPTDPRLLSPEIRWQVLAGDALPWMRPNLESFPRSGGHLRADPERVERWRIRLASLGDGPKIGIGWRSKVMTKERQFHYSRLPQWGDVLRVRGVHFVNLQYDECVEELREAEALFGVRIHAFADVDLMRDLEEAAALTAALDLVISPSTTVAVMSGALGILTWCLITDHSAWETLGTERLPFLPSVRVIRRHWKRPWDAVLADVGVALRAFGSTPSG